MVTYMISIWSNLFEPWNIGLIVYTKIALSLKYWAYMFKEFKLSNFCNL